MRASCSRSLAATRPHDHHDGEGGGCEASRARPAPTCRVGGRAESLFATRIQPACQTDWGAAKPSLAGSPRLAPTRARRQDRGGRGGREPRELLPLQLLLIGPLLRAAVVGGLWWLLRQPRGSALPSARRRLPRHGRGSGHDCTRSTRDWPTRRSCPPGRAEILERIDRLHVCNEGLRPRDPVRRAQVLSGDRGCR